MMSQDAFQADFEGTAESELDEFVRSVKVLLQDTIDKQADKDAELSQILKFGTQDDEASQQAIKQLFEGVTCKDLEQLLSCESFKPHMYTNYLKLMNHLNEL